MSEDKITLSGVDCTRKGCKKHDQDYPPFCLTAALSQEELDEMCRLYKEDPMVQKVAIASAETDGLFYGGHTRVEDVIEFARRIGATKIGIATCVGLLGESRTLTKILRRQGFEVYGVCCKVGSSPKTCLGITEEQLAGFKTGRIMCNPILQARLLNEAGTELNILMGLCVGHDSLFIKHCKGWCTSLVVKDRVLGNNPAAALYTTNSFYAKLLEPQDTPSARAFLAQREAERSDAKQEAEA